MLELDEVARGIPHDKRPVHFGHPLESMGHLAKHGYLSLDTKAVDRLEVGLVTKGDSEVPWVEIQRFDGVRRRLAEMADQLIAEEIERYAIVVAPASLQPSKRT